MFIGKTDVEAGTPILFHLIEELTHWKKTLTLGQIDSRRRRERERLRCFDGFIDSMDMSFSKFQELVQSMGSQSVGHD